MRALGIVVFIVAAIGAALIIGGFVSATWDFTLTYKGHETYNQGVDQAQESLDHLKLKGSTKE